MDKKTIYPEISGGVLVDVHNLPEGWDYSVIDQDDGLDDEEEDSGLEIFAFNASVEIEAKTEAEARAKFSQLRGEDMNGPDLIEEDEG